MGDQPFWGDRVHALGAGPQTIPQKKLTAANLAQALQTATIDRAVREMATKIGEQIRQEDGVDSAVSIIERIIQAA